MVRDELTAAPWSASREAWEAILVRIGLVAAALSTIAAFGKDERKEH